MLDHRHLPTDRQFSSLLRNYWPKLASGLTAKAVHWKHAKANFGRGHQDVPIARAQSNFLYLLARSVKAKTIVEFGSSAGTFSVYLANAIRDNGGGVIISAEVSPQSITQLRQHIINVGVDCDVVLRQGDALPTLTMINQPIDLVLIDHEAALAVNALNWLDPHIRVGGVVVLNNISRFKPDFESDPAFLHNPCHEYLSSTLNFKGGTELLVKVNPSSDFSRLTTVERLPRHR